jgi:hypothetical protein
MCEFSKFFDGYLFVHLLPSYVAPQRDKQAVKRRINTQVLIKVPLTAL